MTDNLPDTFSCPHCGKIHRWKPQLAGRKVKCSCGATLRMAREAGKPAVLITASPPANSNNQLPQAGDFENKFENTDLDSLAQDRSEELNPYELEIPDEQFPPKPEKVIMSPLDSAATDNGSLAHICPQCHESITPGAAICVNCGYDLKRGKKLTTSVGNSANHNSKSPNHNNKKNSTPEKKPPPEEPAYVNAVVAAARRDEDRKKWAERQAKDYARKVNFIWPVTMLIVGPLSILLAAYAIQVASGQPAILALAVIAAMEVFIMTPLLITALFICATLLKLDFGEIKTAAFKTIAINTGPGAIADILSIPLVIMALMGFWLMMAIPLILYMAFMGIPLSKMFDLDFQEALWTILIIAALRLMAFLLIYIQVYNAMFAAHK